MVVSKLPLAGFLWKFYLFFSAIGAQPEAAIWTDGYYWLVAFALVMSVVSLYYYLRVLKAFLVVTDEDNEAKPVAAGTTARLSIFALAAIGYALLSTWNRRSGADGVTAPTLSHVQT